MNNPQDLYRSILHGGNAKAFLLALHRRNTGEILLKDIKAEEQRIKEEKERIRREKWASQGTMLIPAIIPTTPLADNIMIDDPFFFVDEENRQCLKIVDVTAHTLDLIHEAVRIFYKATGVYPEKITPCPSRFGHLRMSHFYHPNGNRIPYIREFGSVIDYDILCRGKRN